jgi:CysZ protein
LAPAQAGDIQEQAVFSVLGSELKRIVYLISRAIPIVIISIIPGVNLIAPVLWGLFGAWGISMEYFAYTLENEGALFVEQRQTGNKKTDKKQGVY